MMAKSSSDRSSFVVLCTPRTGTNLFIEMLNSHPDCFSGYEVLSEMHVRDNHIPWFLPDIADNLKLCDLRRTNPVAFLEKLDQLTRSRGYSAVGFKYMYWEADKTPAVTEYLVSHKDIRVIHIRRRNLLRRLLSQRRAEQTGQWFAEGDQTVELPPIRLTLHDLVADINYLRPKEIYYGGLVESHDVLNLYYEDIVSDTVGTAKQAWRFLGLRDWDSVSIRSKKIGVDPLEHAIENYDELRREITELVSFLD
jgi:LPS sulfotransferase NodH